MRQFVFFALKIAFALALTYWLVASDKLDLRSLGHLVAHPYLIGLQALVWIVGPLVLCSLRWHYLLRGVNLHLSRFEVGRLNLVGIFFNSIIKAFSYTLSKKPKPSVL